VQKEVLLEIMGIQPFYPRLSLPLQKLSVNAEKPSEDSYFCYCYRFKKNEKVLAVLLGQYNTGTLEESNLISAIAKALPCESVGGSETITVSDCRDWGVPILVLGSFFPTLETHSGFKILRASSALDMLADPSNKKKTWLKIKELRSLLEV
jgi:hypothetical protein